MTTRLFKNYKQPKKSKTFTKTITEENTMSVVTTFTGLGTSY
ncbi:hypothetical protein [Tenacibaculum aestuariivivum]